MTRGFNFQNVPTRDVDIGPKIRKSFRSRFGRRLVECDFKALEVAIGCCYHHDPVMIAYLNDPTKDMHRDMACEIFKLTKEQVTSAIRFYAKNGFVFPAFYGSYYLQIAPALWEMASKLELKDGTPLHAHLQKKGIKELGACDSKIRPLSGTFEKWIQEVEREFWDVRFKGYAQWKKDWYEEYLKTGQLKSLTGFVEYGYAGKKQPILSRNDVLNHPIQGSAFHCLLWTLIILQAKLDKWNRKSLLIGQIHDSLLADVPDDEIQTFCHLVTRIVTKELREHWKWICVPLQIEIKVSGIDGNWSEMEPWHCKDGLWQAA